MSSEAPASADVPAVQAVATPTRLETPLETRVDTRGEIPRETTSDTPATAPAPVPSTATGEQIVDAIVLEEPVGSPAPLPPVVASLPRKPVHPLDRPPEPPMPRMPSAPRRALADVLQSFMEESNIRWGELVSGVLIVVSAVGLVISLRATLRQTIPYFPALLFMLVTGGIHFAGQYTLKKWNLKSTSRGLLVIGLLLVPLNFLAAILLAGDTEHLRPVTDPVFLLAVAVGLGGYGYMIWRAAGALLGEHQWRLLALVLGPAASSIAVSRMATAEPSPLSSAALLAVPLLCFAVPLLHHARGASELPGRNRRWRLFSSGLLLELALGVFSLLAPVGLLLSRATEHRDALACASPPLSVLGGMLLMIGLLLHQRLTTLKLALPTLRTIGTALTILGIFSLIGLTVAAWPRPELLVAVGTLDFALLVALAIVAKEPLLHFPAGAALTLATLVGQVRLHGLFGGATSTPAESAADSIDTGRQLIDQLLTGQTGLSATLLAGVFAGVAFGWDRQVTRKIERHCYEGLAALAGTLALGLAIWAGFLRDAAHGSQLATVLLIVQAAAAFAPAIALRRALPMYVGAAIACIAWEHALLHNVIVRAWLPEFVEPEVVAALASAASLALAGVGAHVLGQTLMLDRTVSASTSEFGLAGDFPSAEIDLTAESTSPLASPPNTPTPNMPPTTASEVAPASTFKLPLPKWMLAIQEARSWHATVVLPLVHMALLAAAIVTPIVLWIGDQRYQTGWFEAAVVAVVLLVGALLERRRALWTLFQAATGWLVALAAVVVGQRSAIWSDTIWDLRIIIPGLASLGAWCIAWSGLRIGVARLPKLSELTLPADRWPRLDDGVRAALVVAALLVACHALHPGVALELGWLSMPLNRPIDQSTFAPALARGGASWLALSAIVAAIGATLYERDRKSPWGELLTATLAVPILAASGWNEQLAGASAARWAVAIYAALWAVPALLRARLFPRSASWPTAAVESVRNGSLAFGTLAIVGLTSAVLLRLAGGGALGGPAAESLFARLGSTVSFGVPLAVLVGAYLAHAAHDHDSRLAFIGSLIFQFLVTLGCLIPSLKTGAPDGFALVAKIILWNFGGLACYSLAWLALKPFIEPAEKLSRTLKVQLASLAGVAALFTLFAVFAQAYDTNWATESHLVLREIGRWPSYAVAATAAGVAFWLHKRRASAEDATDFQIDAVEAALWCLVVLSPIIGATLDMFDVTDGVDDRWGLHALEVGWTIAGCALALRSGRDRARQSFVATCVGAGLALLALWHMVVDDPQTPWWATAALVGAAIALSVIGVRRRSQWFAHASTALWPIAAVHFFSEIVRYFPGRESLSIILGPLAVTALVSELWLVLEIRHQRRGEPGLDPRHPWLRAHSTAVLLMLPMILLIFFLGPLAQSTIRNQPGMGHSILPWLSCSSFAVIFIARLLSSLWDRRDKLALVYLYFAVLMTISMFVEFFGLALENHVLALAGGAAAQVMLAGWIWHDGARWASRAQRLKIPEPIEILKRTARWLPWFNLVVSAIVICVAFTTVVTHEARTARVIAGLIPLMLATGLGLLAQRERSGLFRNLALSVAAIAALLLGWADIEPSSNSLFAHTLETVLSRVIRALVVFSMLTFLYGVVVKRMIRLGEEWLASLLTIGRALGGLAFASLLLTLGLEALLFEQGIGVKSLSDAHAGIVAATLVVLTAGLLALALWRTSSLLGANGNFTSGPGDSGNSSSNNGSGDGGTLATAVASTVGPLWQQLTGARTRDELKRMLCVYGAQLVLVLLFGHIYFAKPIWFQGTLREWWPYIVIAIAFAGVGLGELCQRLGLRVLAEPLQRTGGFLPLLPVIGWWIVGSRTDYAGVLFVIGVVYVLLAFLRRSVISRIAAGLAGNGALWAMLQKWEGFSLLEHPQLWLIPPALSILAAAQFNRQRLSATQLAAIRYAAVIVIYLSSTSELFIVGVGKSLWPPMILATLSLAGMFLGVVLRVRAFLYLGASFVLLSVVSMVWHAAKSIEHVWPWWAFGICSGLVILTLLGAFEKKRPEVLALIRKLREWEK